MMLAGPSPAGRDFLFAQYGSDARFDNTSGQQWLADAFIENLNDPALPLLEPHKVRQQWQ
jgi:hypothetical protein